MSEPTAPIAVPLASLLYAPRGAFSLDTAVRGLVERLVNSGVAVTTLDDLDALAAPFVRAGASPPCVLVDLTDLDAGELDDWKRGTELLRRVLAVVPGALPIAITNAATAPLILACLRAGAGDVLDLELEGTGVARAILTRVHQRQLDRTSELTTARALRDMVEELVKDLVRTERRSIDLEDKADPRDARPPAVLLIESDRTVADELADRLETAGVAAYAYVSGEEALREARTLADRTGLDLALVAAQLPGIDGLETIRRLREQIADLDAFLVTSVDDGHLAADAADLGVVGFVLKPLTEIDDIVARLAQLARDALRRSREHRYVDRIKTRHERVLARYRALPREP